MGDPSEFCDKMEAWAEACMTPLSTDNEYTTAWRKDFSEHWACIRRAIYKSNLLWRLMYGDEKIRTRPCPVHKGKWSGCTLPADSGCNGACMSGHNVTGWLPEEDAKPDSGELRGTVQIL